MESIITVIGILWLAATIRYEGSEARGRLRFEERLIHPQFLQTTSSLLMFGLMILLFLEYEWYYVLIPPVVSAIISMYLERKEISLISHTFNVHHLVAKEIFHNPDRFRGLFNVERVQGQKMINLFSELIEMNPNLEIQINE